jgi:hypothetical protein
LSLEKDVDRARLAGEVLNNPVYAESYAQIEQEFTRLWRDSRDKDEREDIHRALLMLGKARTILEATMRSGQVAAKELERKRSLSERMTGGWRKTA